ncbi:MAG: ABC transporter C-terminal domain-containing protein [Acidimicrobiaceae bacterium]|nr:ABC transporter C-terminal domain-containing protein [Acidimicrobiaceae bacterium]
MTAAVPAQRAAPQMTHTPDPTATPQADAVAPPAGVESTRPRLREQVAENLLLSLLGGLLLALLTFFGTVVVALFIFNLNSINDRLDSIEGRIDHLADRIDRLETKMDERFAELDARLTAQIAELDRKMTALTAHLNATKAVDAALEHRLLTPDAGTTEPEGKSPG